MVGVVGMVETTGCVGCIIPAGFPLVLVGWAVTAGALIVIGVAATVPDGIPLLGIAVVAVLTTGGVWK